jgi:hypothetical protein
MTRAWGNPPFPFGWLPYEETGPGLIDGNPICLYSLGRQTEPAFQGEETQMKLATQNEFVGWKTSRTTFWRIVSPAGRRLVKVVIDGDARTSRAHLQGRPDWQKTELLGRGA